MCKCDVGYGGFDCSQDEYCPNQCSNHGVCGGYRCLCDDGWFGVDCSSVHCTGDVDDSEPSGTFAFTHPGAPFGRVGCTLYLMPTLGSNYFRNISLNFTSMNIDNDNQTRVMVIEFDDNYNYYVIGVYTSPHSGTSG